VSLVESARPIQLVAAVFGAILGICNVVGSQTPAPSNSLAGVWKLNLAKSTFAPGPPPYKRSTCTIEILGNDLRVAYDTVGTRGGLTHMEWVGKLDGKDYSIQGVDTVLTNAYTQIDERTFEIVVKSDGSRAATARITISQDGRTLTSVTSTHTSARQTRKTTIVYDKQ